MSISQNYTETVKSATLHALNDSYTAMFAHIECQGARLSQEKWSRLRILISIEVIHKQRFKLHYSA